MSNQPTVDHETWVRMGQSAGLVILLLPAAGVIVRLAAFVGDPYLNSTLLLATSAPVTELVPIGVWSIAPVVLLVALVSYTASTTKFPTPLDKRSPRPRSLARRLHSFFLGLTIAGVFAFGPFWVALSSLLLSAPVFWAFGLTPSRTGLGPRPVGQVLITMFALVVLAAGFAGLTGYRQIAPAAEFTFTEQVDQSDGTFLDLGSRRGFWFLAPCEPFNDSPLQILLVPPEGIAQIDLTELHEDSLREAVGSHSLYRMIFAGDSWTRFLSHQCTTG